LTLGQGPTREPPKVSNSGIVQLDKNSKRQLSVNPFAVSRVKQAFIDLNVIDNAEGMSATGTPPNMPLRKEFENIVVPTIFWYRFMRPDLPWFRVLQLWKGGQNIWSGRITKIEGWHGATRKLNDTLTHDNSRFV
jgi:hypothetical protein